MTQDMTVLPRLLLITEAPLSEDRGGLNRTLLNLFQDYPANKFMLYTCGDTAQTSAAVDKNVARFSEGSLPYLNNRIGLAINGITAQVNLQLMDWLPIPVFEQIQAFDPDIILICPDQVFALLMGKRVAQVLDCPYLIYFMDNWVAQCNHRWLSGNAQSITVDLLHNASGWLMISESLKTTLAERYKLTCSRHLIVHNPVNVTALPKPDFEPHGGTFKIVYAGSIWPMHYDAVAIIAQATSALRQEGIDIELVLHTSPSFWKQYQSSWETWQVTYGSLVPYEQLQTHLQRADLLLVASSFDPAQAHMTRSSVQTKITDYMASGRPIVSCGPEYAACNLFLEQWSCGLVCDTCEVSKVKEFLAAQVKNRASNQTLAKEAYRVLREHFEQDVVIQKLYRFIGESTG